MKAYTDLSQSKKLAKILPLESADMHYNNASIKGINYADEHRAELMEYNRAIKVLSKYTINPLFEVIPCWSLAALLDILSNGNMLVKTTDSEYYCLAKDVMTKHYDNPVDACVDMILKLKESNLI